MGIAQVFAGNTSAQDTVRLPHSCILLTPACPSGFLYTPFSPIDAFVAQRPVVEVLRSGSRAIVPEAGGIVIAKVFLVVILSCMRSLGEGWEFIDS